ncbi:helix-turn-helix domain-containing protein [Rhizobium lentis]|uniref:helix-turn-helix domain-containing protein n=1 Tax=Rhizobium lentis TaxID=1138194 RepID=UPI001C82CC5D|nr:helix-turn-helix domain-containing protein [Rhizobium lentis]MBX4975018.1 helix-turn-helix domain-containing protein [Rhizobium lentis]MBX4987396.1 helix-turn-helix domain-containing protein [Rhizobium lentis]MBX5005840.1 helix-turn-helix domain-containing protein [Rhizobium lentis]MBX5026978.1 helix-turn-helix domain-containing protein [Rhizobium lentis]
MNFTSSELDQFVTTKEAARRLAISEKTLLRHVRLGRLEYVDLGTESREVRRFSVGQLERFILTRRRKEIVPCLSISQMGVRTSITTSKSVVAAFTDLQSPRTAGKPLR